MITAELTQKIDTLSNDEYRMVEVYVDSIVGQNIILFDRIRETNAA